LKGLNAHSKVLSIKVMHSRIPGDFQYETIAGTRTIHLTVMENILTSTQKSASCLKKLTFGNLHSVHRKEERLP